MATITKRLCMPVGSYVTGDKTKIEYREIGVIVEFEKDGNTWQEVKLNADILNPTLFTLARQQMEKGTSAVRVKLFDMERKKRVPDGGSDDAQEFDESGVPF